MHLFLIILVPILYVLFKIFYNLVLHPLRSYPGPLLWRASRIPWALSMQDGHLHHALRDFHQKYGPVVRIAPDELSYIDPRAWHDIYQPKGSGHAVFVKTDKWVKPQPGDPHNLMSVDEGAHVRHLRALRGAFTDHAVMEKSRVLEKFVGVMIEKFRERVALSSTHQGEKQTDRTGEAVYPSAVVNMTDWFNFLTFDISGALAFTNSFFSVESGKAHPWVEISCSFGKGLALMATVNFFSPLNKILAWTVPESVRLKMRFHRQLVQQKLRQRLEMRDEVDDIVGEILRYNEEKGEVKIPMDELEADLSVLIFAGSETTSTALNGVIVALLRHQEAMKKVVEEVRGAFGTEEEITVANVGTLAYVDAVIKESLRLGPPAAVGLPRVVPNGGENICGRFVPSGTLVSLNQYPAFRSPSNFTEPDSFIPERFLPDSPFPSDNMAVFEPFLVGRHRCLGQKIAWAEMRLVLARLLWAFDIGAVGDVEDFANQRTFMFWEKKELKVRLRERM